MGVSLWWPDTSYLLDGIIDARPSARQGVVSMMGYNPRYNLSHLKVSLKRRAVLFVIIVIVVISLFPLLWGKSTFNHLIGRKR